MYVFVALYMRSTRLRIANYTPPGKRSIQLFAALFGLGAILSVFNMPNGADNPNFLFSLRYLPNYIYWAVLVIFLIHFRRLINIDLISQYITYGLIVYLPFYFIRENFLPGVPIVQKTSPNNFAFLMICFSPIAIAWVKRTKGKLLSTLLWIVILGMMLYLGRRAGFALVFISGFLVISFNNINSKSYFQLVAIGILLFVFFQIPLVESMLYSGSPRIHQLIYESKEVRGEDRSFLTRRAMFEKGLNFFEENPVSGIGLLNFSRVEGEIDGDFEGARYVINKDINSLSAHNSYVIVFSEGGFAMLIPFLFLHLRILWFLLTNHRKLDISTFPVFLAYVTMLIHYNSIAALVNVYGWFVVGLAAMLMYQLSERQVTGKQYQV